MFVAITAPDILCPDRRQRVLPLLFARPLTGVDYVIAKVGALVLDFVRVLVPAPGGAVRRTSARERQCARLHRDNTDVLWKVPVAVALLAAVLFGARRAPSRRSASRRIVAGASFIGLFLVSSITAGVLAGETSSRRRPVRPAALINVLGLPLYLRDLVFLGHIDPRVAAQGRGERRICTRSLAYSVVLAAGIARAAAPLSLDGAMTSPSTIPGDPAFVADATVEVDRGICVVRSEGRALRVELLVRSRRHRAARTERCGQDDAHARDHRPDAA